MSNVKTTTRKTTKTTIARNTPIVKGDTSQYVINGIEISLHKDALDDLELFEKLVEVEEGNTLAIPAVLKGILGVEQYERVKEELRDENGRVKASDFADILNQLFVKNGDLPN